MHSNTCCHRKRLVKTARGEGCRRGKILGYVARALPSPVGKRMRELAVALGVSLAVLLAGGIAWKADATTWRWGTLNLPGLTKNYSPIEKAACFGWGRHCPPRFTWRCGPSRCWCRPC